MPRENSVIETGVDKLVEIIRAKKRVSIQDAAKSLGVGPIVVEEWADFLEEEGIISIEYKFATPYLVERKATKEEVEKKEKDFHSKREGFIRKAEVTLAVLDREGEDFQKFRNSFEKLKKDLGTDLSHVESELQQLEKYEALKNNIDKQIIDQEKEFRAKLDSYEAEIKREEEKYQNIIEEVDKEEEKLDKERLENLSLREKEMQLKKRLSEFEDNIAKINEAIEKENTVIDDSENRIKNLRSIATTIKRDFDTKKTKGDELTKESNSHKERISELQQEILNKIEKNRAKISREIEDGKTSTEKFREFFDKKVSIEKLIKDMDQQKDELERDLIELIKKAKSSHLSSNSASLKNHIKELEKAFENIKKKKARFEEEALKLSSVLK